MGCTMQKQAVHIFVYILFVALAINLSAKAGASFVDNEDGTVTDTKTGLMWQKTDDGQTRTWPEALAYCESCTLAGYTDWRLPNIRELESIVDWQEYNPAIDPVFDCRSSFYWSGSTYVDRPGYAWFVSFFNGLVGHYAKDTHYYVRCVRAGTIPKLIKSLWVPDVGTKDHHHLIKVSAQNVGSFSGSDEINVKFPSFEGEDADLGFEWILTTNRKGIVNIWIFLETNSTPDLEYDINPENSLSPVYWRSKQMTKKEGKANIWTVTLDEQFNNGDCLYFRINGDDVKEYDFNPFYVTGVNSEEPNEPPETKCDFIIDSEENLESKLKVSNWNAHQTITFTMDVHPHKAGVESVEVQCASSSAKQEASCPIFPEKGLEPDSQGRCPTEVLLGNDDMACGFSQQGRQVSLFYPQKGAYPQLPYITDAKDAAHKPFLGAREWEGMFAGIRKKHEKLTEGRWEFSWLHSPEWYTTEISQPFSGENVGGMELKYARRDKSLSVSESSFVKYDKNTLIRHYTIDNKASISQEIRFIYYAFPNLGTIQQSPFFRMDYFDLVSGWCFQDNDFESIEAEDGSHILIWSDPSDSIFYAMAIEGPSDTTEQKAVEGYVEATGVGSTYQYLTDGIFSSIPGDSDYHGWYDTGQYNAYIEWDLGTLKSGSDKDIFVFECCGTSRDSVINQIEDAKSEDISTLKSNNSENWEDFFSSIPAINDLSNKISHERLELLKRCFLVLRLCRDKTSGAMVASPQLCPKYYGTWPRDAAFQAAAWLMGGLDFEAEGLWSWLFDWDENWPPLISDDQYRGFDLVLRDIAGFERGEDQVYWGQCYGCDKSYVGLPFPDYPNVTDVRAIVEEDQMGLILWGIWLFYKNKERLPDGVDIEEIHKVASYLVERICTEEDVHNGSPKEGLILPSLDIAESPVKFYPEGNDVTDIGQSLWTNSAAVAGLHGAAEICLAKAEKTQDSTIHNQCMVKANLYKEKARKIEEAVIEYFWDNSENRKYFHSRWQYFFKEKKPELWEIPIGFADPSTWDSFLLEGARDDAFFSVPFGLTLPKDNKTENHLSALSRAGDEAIFTAGYMYNALVYLQRDEQDKATAIIDNVLNNLTKAEYVPENFYPDISGLYGAAKPLGWAHASVALALMAEADEKYNLPLPQKVDINEALDNSDLTFKTGGNALWFGQNLVQKVGDCAAQSGAIKDSQESYLETNIVGPGKISFWWRVSSEHGHDFLEFYIDGDLKKRISGEKDWAYVNYELGTGNHILRWTYVKDFSLSAGSDCGWVDCVTSPVPLVLKYAPILRFNWGEEYFPTTIYDMVDKSEIWDLNEGKNLTIEQGINTSSELKGYLSSHPDSTVYFDLDDRYWGNWNSTDCVVYTREYYPNDPPYNDRIYLQYWFFYIYNNWWNDHEGDWEMITVELDKEKKPLRIGYSQHSGNEVEPWEEKMVKTWQELMETNAVKENHPLVYVSKGSHASYPDPGKTWQAVGWDEHYGDGGEIKPYDYQLSNIEGNDLWQWIEITQLRWGQCDWPIMFYNDSELQKYQKENFNPLGNDGPPSPIAQGDKWDNPGVWMDNSQKKECRALPWLQLLLSD